MTKKVVALIFICGFITGIAKSMKENKQSNT